MIGSHFEPRHGLEIRKSCLKKMDVPEEEGTAMMGIDVRDTKFALKGRGEEGAASRP